VARCRPAPTDGPWAIYSTIWKETFINSGIRDSAQPFPVKEGPPQTIRNDAQTLDDLVSSLPPGSAITEPASMGAYRWHRANDPTAGVPLAVTRVT